MRTTNLRWTSPQRSFALAEALAENAPLAPIQIDPPLSPRDEVIFLLHVAAEAEHALLVQYLYAAFSLRLDSGFGQGAPANASTLTKAWFKDIFQTAQEEMGHLLTVQNILSYVGGPVTFEREDFPFRADVYPFHFRLQPLQLRSLAKYVAAERPDPVDGLSPEEKKDLDDLLEYLTHTETINRVGRVYDRLIQTAGKLTLDDVRPDRTGLQQTPQDWSTDDPASIITRDATTNQITAVGSGIIVYPINNSKDMIDALTAIAIQGEGGASTATTNKESHFRRFFNIYLAFPRDPAAWSPVLPVAVNPNTTHAPVDFDLLYPEEKADEVELKAGRITNLQTRLWAQLFNNRYRILLSCLIHSLSTDVLGGDEASRTRAADHRVLLIGWAMEEMRNLRALSGLLNGLYRTDKDADGMAGATFELPYTLNFSNDHLDRWRTQRDLLSAAALLCDRITPTQEQAKIFKKIRDTDGADDTAGRRKTIADILKSIAPPAPAPLPVPRRRRHRRHPRAVSRFQGTSYPYFEGSTLRICVREELSWTIRFTCASPPMRRPFWTGSPINRCRRTDPSGRTSS
jgi:hypothetical protein